MDHDERRLPGVLGALRGVSNQRTYFSLCAETLRCRRGVELHVHRPLRLAFSAFLIARVLSLKPENVSAGRVQLLRYTDDVKRKLDSNTNKSLLACSKIANGYATEAAASCYLSCSLVGLLPSPRPV